MALEDELSEEMQRMVKADPSLLRGATGIGEQSLTTQDQIDLCLRIAGAQRKAILRVAREVDEIKGTGDVREQDG